LADGGDVDDRADAVLGEFAEPVDGVADPLVFVAPLVRVVPAVVVLSNPNPGWANWHLGTTDRKPSAFTECQTPSLYVWHGVR
jgi:hypothetical protein